MRTTNPTSGEFYFNSTSCKQPGTFHRRAFPRRIRCLAICRDTSSYDFTTGRRLFALEKVESTAADLGAEEIQKRVDEALEVNRRAQQLEGQWRRARNVSGTQRGEAASIDAKLDRASGGLHSQLQAYAEGPFGFCGHPERTVAPSGL
ncbi:MAG: hypothetical protein ABEL76_17750, partial [Bradymonadaceae bacterium]